MRIRYVSNNCQIFDSFWHIFGIGGTTNIWPLARLHLKAIVLYFQILLDWKWWLNGVITIIVAIFGLTGNFVSILVMLQPKLKNSFNQLLIALCVFDSVFIVCNLLNSGPTFGIKHRKSANSHPVSEGGDPLEEWATIYREVLLGGPVLLSNSQAGIGRNFSQPRAHHLLVCLRLCTEA